MRCTLIYCISHGLIRQLPFSLKGAGTQLRYNTHTKQVARNHEVLATELEPEGQAKRSKAADADICQTIDDNGGQCFH